LRNPNFLSATHTRIRRYAAPLLLQPLILGLVVVVAAAQPALAVTCQNPQLSEPGQFSENGNYEGQFGYLTDPSDSSVPGTDSNHDYHEHTDLGLSI